MQKGRIEQRHGAWHLRYRVNGKQVTRKLADVNDRYRTERSVRPLADEILQPVNEGRESNGPMTLQAYVEQVYFPSIKQSAATTARPASLRDPFIPFLPRSKS